MGSLDFVVQHELVELVLDLLDADALGLLAGDAEALVEQRPVHAFDEAVGTRRADLGLAGLDVFQGEQQS